MSITPNDLVFPCAILLLASFWEAHRQDHHLRDADPRCQRFFWGYFFGYAKLFQGVLAVFLVFGIPGETGHDRVALIGVAIYFSIQSVLGWFVIKRQRWAWIVGTLASLNPAIYIANAFYGKTRWRELEPSERPDNGNASPRPPTAKFGRVAVIGGSVLLVTLFIVVCASSADVHFSSSGSLPLVESGTRPVPELIVAAPLPPDAPAIDIRNLPSILDPKPSSLTGADMLGLFFKAAEKPKGAGSPEFLLLETTALNGRSVLHAYANHLVALLYLSGASSVPAHLHGPQAMSFFRRAADLGYGEAQHAVGKFYEQGTWVIADQTEAYICFALAVASGCQNATIDRDRVRAQLDPSLVSRADSEAKVRLLALHAATANR